jgi:hypothetical protein
MTTPDDIMAEITKLRRVCPQPTLWNELWQLLPGRRQVGAGWEPSLPLILAAWHHTSDSEKRARLRLHLQWAANHGVLDVVAAFLQTLKSQDWHTES